MKNFILGSALALILVFQASPVSAETTTTTTAADTNSSMLMMMQTLMKQVEMLQKQLAMLQAGMKEMPAKGIKSDDVKNKGGELREKVHGVVGGIGTTSVNKAIATAELTIDELTEVVGTITDTKLVKKTGKILTEAERKLADAKEKVAKGKYRDALAKAMQAKRLAERGLAEVADEEEESIDDDDNDDDKDHDNNDDGKDENEDEDEDEDDR
jgi:hypothetical protein